MQKAGVVIDDWKLKIFTEELNKGGFEFTQHPGVTDDTLILQVMTPSAEALTPTIQTAQERCAALKLN